MVIVVSNREVCLAMRAVWKAARFLPEPSGALGVAGLWKETANLRGKKALAVITGANMDFKQISKISSRLSPRKITGQKVFLEEVDQILQIS